MCVYIYIYMLNRHRTFHQRVDSSVAKTACIVTGENVKSYSC